MNSNEVAIKVEGVSKSFKLPHEKNSSIKGAVINFYKQNKSYETQEVLKDISFEIKKGEFFGIVGRNGSGKSTLLKLLAGIYTPDKGSIAINGKLTPFIELGVGFNPELSGRENVFLNGALLGFNRKEMLEMYDEIVEFAELERFMDQKLKNYSSGMQVRLAFSIAIRAQANILVLDEVLAVGDSNFQKKCNDYFEQQKNKKQTIVLVTHDMASVQKYCSKAMLIDKGKIKVIGDSNEVANQYMLDNMDASKRVETSDSTGLSATISEIEVVPKTKRLLTNKDTFEFLVNYTVTDTTEVYIGISVLYNNVPIIEHATLDFRTTNKKGKKQTFKYSLPLSRFNSGDFKVVAAIFDAKTRTLLGFSSDAKSTSLKINNPGPTKRGLLAERGTWSEVENEK